jgi:hypothetical protein
MRPLRCIVGLHHSVVREAKDGSAYQECDRCRAVDTFGEGRSGGVPGVGGTVTGF